MKESNKSEIIEEKSINNALNSVSIEGMEKIINQMKNSICKIYLNDGNTGTGFFCLIPYIIKSKNIPFLITNEHVLNKNNINNKIIISLENEKIKKEINLKIERIIYINKEIDVTLIEIKSNIDNIDINNCIELDNDIIYKDDKYINNIIKNESIYILHYPGKKKNIVVSYGLLSYISEEKIYYQCNTEYDSSGSPILSLDKNKIIGIHCGANKNKNNNIGKLFKYIIFKLNNINEITNELNNIKNIKIDINNKEKIYEDGKYIGDFKNGLKEGKGIYYYNNGDRYEGDYRRKRNILL